MNKLLLWILTIFLSGSLFGQISFRNQLIYTHWEDYDRSILEDWADLNYQINKFKAGIRYEVNHPPDPFIFDRDSLVDEYALTFRYAQMRYKRMQITVGNYYEMFGRGLTLRTYEDRNLRVDNNLDGVKFGYKGKKFRAKAIAGKMRDKYNRRKEILYGADGEFKPLSGLTVGGSYLMQDGGSSQQDALLAIRGNYSRDWYDFYTEVVQPDWHNKTSVYAALNLSFEKISITMEYKDYDSLSFKNKYDTEYNTAPSLSREHTFSLLNRHPHALNQDNEKGYQFEATITPWERLEVLLNHSQTFSQQKQRLFSEWYAQVHMDFEQDFELYGGIAWNEDLSTQNLTPLIDGSFDISKRDQIHVSYQHQHTTNTLRIKNVYKSEYDNDLILLEYSRSPWLSAAIVVEWTNEDQLPNWSGGQNKWFYGQLNFNIWQNQRLSLLYGSRKEGFVCVGGVCRYEPEFKGFELQLTNRF